MSCKMGNFMNLRVFALLGVLLLAGCSGLSVRHLPSNPWKNEASQNIQMRYLAFQYQVIPVGNELGIVAEAYPVIDKLPDWASWYGEIMLSVYVSDEYGRVLASKDTVLVPRPLNPGSRLKSASIWGRTGISRFRSPSDTVWCLRTRSPTARRGGGCWYRKGRSKNRRSAYAIRKGAGRC